MSDEAICPACGWEFGHTVDCPRVQARRLLGRRIRQALEDRDDEELGAAILDAINEAGSMPSEESDE